MNPQNAINIFLTFGAVYFLLIPLCWLRVEQKRLVRNIYENLKRGGAGNVSAIDTAQLLNDARAVTNWVKFEVWYYRLAGTDVVSHAMLNTHSAVFDDFMDIKQGRK